MKHAQKKTIYIPQTHPAIPFKIGAPSMVYGKDVVKNSLFLANNGSGLNFMEILLFYTPELHNIPTIQELRVLKKIQDSTATIYTVHLPASLEIASNDLEIREESTRLIINIVLKTCVLNPAHYILHIPVTPPTLVAVPGQYYRSESCQPWDEWTSRAMDSFSRIVESVGCGRNFLIENINYSPKFLEPLLKAGCGELCLDIGHLLLGDEDVELVLECFWEHIQEIHLHGVKDYTEHLSLDTAPRDKVVEWLSCLKKWDYQGLINLEIFSPEDLKTSLDTLSGIMQDLSS